ncbi:hypothetical protein CTheo_2922 [Ceratobasidium theobromae]|uniref:Transmembrane protein n=1 Tax=Ceratobasidium theobromae TaxID=1582974 RepID=A0A5N5QPQ7_9AGAM|nr:hypothetical protein CTheo_2922 [Ceratobasidium theobromae]
MEKTNVGYTIMHQPISQAYMSPSFPAPHLHGQSTDTESRCCSSRNKCHARRLRVLLPALVALVVLGALSIWLMYSDMRLGMSELAADVGTSLWKRQSASTSTNTDSPFVKNKRESPIYQPAPSDMIPQCT